MILNLKDNIYGSKLLAGNLFPLVRLCLDLSWCISLSFTQDSKPVNGESEAEKKDVVSESESKDPKSAEQEEESDHNSQNNER